MKVILSESQVLNILNEITSEQRMDFLLDKVSEGGIESLTPMERIELRRLSGENIDSDEENAVGLSDKIAGDEETGNDDEILDKSNLVGYIMDTYPDGKTYNIGNVTWNTFVDKEMGEDLFKISITDGDRLIDLYPFENGEDKIMVKTTERRPFSLNLQSVPTTRDEMEYFMRSLIHIEIPKIITYVLRTS